MGSAGTASFKLAVEGTEVILQKLKALEGGLNSFKGNIDGLKTAIGSGVGTALPAGFDQIGTSAEQASLQTQSFTERMTGFQGNLLTAATSVGTFTASIFGIDAAMDNLTRTELALEQARVRQSNMQTTLHAQEERLNELRTSGTASAEEIAVAEERVSNTRQQLEVQTERVSFMQQNLNEDYSQFGAQILPQVITATLSGVTAFQSIFTLVGKNEKAVAILNKAWSALSTTFSSVQITPLTGALTNATASTSGWQKALSFVPLALTAVGTAVAIAGTAIGLYVTNAFGARDAMHTMGAAIGEAVPPLQGFLNILENSGRLWTNLLTGPPIFAKTMGEMSVAVENASSNVDASLASIGDSFQVITTNVQGAFQNVGSRYEEFKSVFADQEPYVKATAGSQMMVDMVEQLGQALNSGKDISRSNLQIWAGDVSAWSIQVANSFIEAGKPVPTFITEIQRLTDELNKQLQLNPDISFEDIKVKINSMLKNISDTIIKWGPEFQAELADVIQKATDPIGFHLEEIQTKLAALKLPPELALQTTRFTENIEGMVDATLKQIDTLALSDEQMQKIAYASLPAMTKGLQTNHPEIQTNADALQWFVDNIDETTAKSNPLIKAILDMAKAADIQKTKTGEVTEKLTEEQQKIQELAKSYFDLNLVSEEEIRANEQKVNTITDVIEGYTDQIAALQELRTKYGENETAVYGVNQATQDHIESLQEQVLQEQELVLAGIDVVAILDDTTESQIALNDAMIEGVTAAADFVTELVEAEKQTEAYGKALADNVMAVLEEMPQTVGDFADAFREILPNLFASLDEFQGKIKPFDKQSIKDYKEELKDLDVPKSLRDLYVDSAKVWQDKDEIIAEGEALFAGMAGSLTHSFEEIDVEDVTTFLDEIEGRLDELEAEGVGTGFTDNIRAMIDEIRNSDDPVQALLTNFDSLKAAMDPEAFDAITVSMRAFGGEGGALANAVENADSLTQALTLLGDPDLINQLAELDATIQSIGANLQEGIKGKEGLKDFFTVKGAEAQQAQLLAQGKGGAAGGGAAAGTDEAGAAATGWENAQTRIQAATTAIQTAITTASTLIQQSVTGMTNVVNALLGTIDAKVVATQGIWSTFSTSLATYGTSMSTNFATSQQLINQSLLLMIEGVTNTHTSWATFSESLATYSESMATNYATAQEAINESLLLQIEGVINTHETWSNFSTSVATYTDSMTTNTENWSEATISSFDDSLVSLKAFHEAFSSLSTSTATYTKSMTTNIESWEKATVEAFDNVKEGAEDATKAVEGLQDAIAALKSKTVTIKVNVEQSGGGGGNQYGGVEILNKSKIFMGGEGHKPEIHFFYPLDQMSQSHAKSEYKLPFNMGDLTGPKLNAASIVGTAGGGGTPQMVLPSNLVSNINMRANLNIDLGNEIKKVVRQEIKAVSEARLDRMPMR